MKKLLLIFLLLTNNVFAQSIELSEISFKDPSSDWIELKINSKPENPIEIRDDGLITKIAPTKINNEKFIIIHFKSQKNEIISKNGILNIYIKKSGLTGTTEQITLKSESKIIDVICWQNAVPTEKELADSIALCTNEIINSEEIKKSQSIANISNNWQIFPHPTKGAANIFTNSHPEAKITIQKGSLTSEIPFSLNLDGTDSFDPDNDEISYKWTFPNNQTKTTKNPPSHRIGTSGEYEISLTVTDQYGLSDTETLKISALNKSEDLKSQELLDQILKPNPNASPTPKLPWQTYFMPPIVFLMILTAFLALSSPYK